MSESVFVSRERLEKQLQEVQRMKDDPKCTQEILTKLSELETRITMNIERVNAHIARLNYPTIIEYDIDESTLN